MSENVRSSIVIIDPNPNANIDADDWTLLQDLILVFRSSSDVAASGEFEAIIFVVAADKNVVNANKNEYMDVQGARAASWTGDVWPMNAVSTRLITGSTIIPQRTGIPNAHFLIKWVCNQKRGLIISVNNVSTMKITNAFF